MELVMRPVRALARRAAGTGFSVLSFVAMAVISTAAMAATAAAPAADSVWFGKAVELYEDHKPGAVPVAEKLAAMGDARAQYMLGVLWMQGKLVPQDKVKGYAWLQVAAKGHDGQTFTRHTQDAAKAAVLSLQEFMTGSEAIKADQLTDQIIKEANAAWSASVRRVVSSRAGTEVTALDPIAYAGPAKVNVADAEKDGPRVVYGCAGTQTKEAYCPSQASLPTPRCTGDVVSLDGAWGKDNKSILKPRRNKDFPVMAHHNGIDGSTTMLLHLDRSGWVCLVEVIRSTGFEDMDSTMMRYIGQQRYEPALHDGKPVEALAVVSGTFDLDLDFTP